MLAVAGGVGHIPLVHRDWFKAVAGVGHSQAMWPQPWHVKHWRELGSLLLAVPSCLVLVLWLFCPWFLLMVVPVPWPVHVLQSGLVCPRPVWSLWELGWPGVPLSVHPSHGLSPSLGLFGGTGWAAALIRAAISLAICCSNSVVLSPGSVVMAALGLTLSCISSFLLSAFQATTINCE